ncbi:mRNA cap guanine-N7 methyltransferase 2 [Hordeum vulgare]|nr:mRNA cap guanine-N7 methyltransferase 2 [Hordeum vulgare]
MAAVPHHLLYEFAKAALIKIFAFPYATVCDMYYNGGADTEKWADAQAGHYIGIDASASAVSSDARELWETKWKPFTTEFIELNPSAIISSRHPFLLARN